MLVATRSRFRLFGNHRRRSGALLGPYFADGVSIGNRPFAADWQETSGICRPQRADNIGHIWCQSDGTVNKLFALQTSDCAAHGEWTLAGATPVDNEDIASATVAGQPYIYLADMGNNGNAADSRGTGIDLRIYRVKEPSLFVEPPESDYPFGDELVLYHFENDAGVVNSGTGGATYNSVFVGNGAYATDPKFGTHAATFDGQGDAVDSKFGSGRNPTSSPFSVSCWAKRIGTGGGADQHLFGVSASPAATRCYVRYRSASGNWGIRVQGAAEVVSSVAVTLNQWFHVCLVMDGSTARLYVDGTQAATSAYTSYTLPGPIYLGNLWENGAASATEGWHGRVDDFAVYARALSTGEVQDIANAGITGGYIGGSLAAGTDYETIPCAYPAGDFPSHRDAETLLADPDTGDLYIVTKRITPAQVYRLAHAASYAGTQTLEALGTIWTGPLNTPYDGANGGYYVGGDISPDGREIVLKNHGTTFYFPRNKATQSILQALQATGVELSAYVGGGRPSSYPNNEPQGEGICFTDGATLFTASEAGDPNRTAASASNYPVFKYTRLAKPHTEVSFQDGANGYSGTSDTYLQVTTPTTPHGTETTIVVDLDAGDERLGLLKFDLASIPQAANIVGCELYLAITEEGQDFALYRCFVPWDESSTYSSVNSGAGIPRNDIAAASNEDAVHGAPASVAANHGYDGITGTVRIKIPPQTIKDWIDGTRPNYGWVLINVGASLDGFQFGSRQNATQGNRPRLVVRYLI